MIFGFLLFADREELDLVGPWEMVACGARMPMDLKNEHSHCDLRNAG